MSKRKIFSTSEVIIMLKERGKPRAERTLQQYHTRDGLGEKIAGRLFFNEADIQHIIDRTGKVGQPRKEK